MLTFIVKGNAIDAILYKAHGEHAIRTFNVICPQNSVGTISYTYVTSALILTFNFVENSMSCDTE